jgi:hypothetical protein
MKEDRDDDAIIVLSKLRRQSPDNPLLLAEYVEIRAEVIFEQQFVRETYPNVSAFRLQGHQVSSRSRDLESNLFVNNPQYWALLSNKSHFRRLAIGCSIMFFQVRLSCL